MIIELKILFLIGVANGAPIIGRCILGNRLAYPLDGNLKFLDGYPILGASKTITGIVLAILASALAAVILNLPWTVGLLVAVFAMLGDIVSSFIKRRLNMPSSSMAFGLDQIPESLLPLLVVKEQLGLSWWSVIVLLVAFIFLELFLSPLLFKWRIRNRPY